MDELVVIGLGHIGGSVAAAARERSLFRRVVGVELQPEIAASGGTLAVLADVVVHELSDLGSAGLVVVAVPPHAIADVVVQALEGCPRAVVTDTGSLKADVVRQVRARSPHAARFVGAHPMAGNTGRGPGSADPKLFDGRTVIVAVDRDTNTQALAAVEALWRALGAEIVREEPESHDRAMAFVSHLPHAIAYALVAATGGDDEERTRFLRLAGPSWQSVTRVAGSHPRLWTELFLANADQLDAALDRFRSELGTLEALVRRRRPEDLEGWLSRAYSIKRGSP